MDVNQRFDQLESLLVDLARKQDQQAEQIKQLIAEVRRIGTAMNEQGEAIGRQGEAIGRQSEAIGRQGEAIVRIERRLDAIEEQIGAIINILKLSAEPAHSQAEQRQDAMMVEIREHRREIKEQGQRLDAALNVAAANAPADARR